MAYTNIPVDSFDSAGAEPTQTAFDTGSDGMAFENDGHTLLFFDNSSGAGAITLDIHTNVTKDGLALPNKQSISIGAGKLWVGGPYSKEVYDQKSGTDKGKVRVAINSGDASNAKISAFKCVN